MRTYRKTITVIEMTDEEVESLFTLATQAKEGHTSHYAEKQMSDGKFFGISLVPRETQHTAPMKIRSKY